jgi:hypothetical protein
MTVLAQSNTLAPLEWLALKIVGKTADNYRDACPTGKLQEIDFLLRVHGHVDVSPDRATTRKITNGPDAETVLSHVFKRLPPETVQVLKKSILEAYAADHDMPIEEGHLDAARLFVASMQQITTVSGSAKGSTRGVFQVGRVEVSQITQRVNEEIQAATRLITFEDPKE